MIRKTESILPKHIQVTFELPSDVWGDKLCVVGEFNHWSIGATPLRQDRDGTWRAVLDIPCNHCYEFYYWIDGQVCTDSRSDRCAYHRSNKGYS